MNNQTNQHKYPVFKLKQVGTANPESETMAPEFALRPVSAPTDTKLEIIPVQVAADSKGADRKFFLFGEGIVPSHIK